MNESARPRPALLAALLLAAALAACAPSSAGTPPLQGASMGGPFTLTDQNGRRVSDRDFAGRYRIVYFGFTFCPDVCPLDMQVLGAALRRFEAQDPRRAARVQPIFITVDPARDTPPVLRRFVAVFHPRFIGLTGSEQEIARTARAYGVFHERGPADPAGAYNISHSRTVALYGPQGEPIALLSTDRGAATVAAELDRWVR